MQDGLECANRFVVGHPFYSPHLIPLVEVVGGEKTDPSAVDSAINFYNKIDRDKKKNQDPPPYK